jgi:gamma-D-glutamyl-L-lysine dipeptidyl-peptidase
MQNILDNFSKSVDKRTSLFDVKIDSDTDGILALSGHVLDKSQLGDLSRLFPDRKLDTVSIRILNLEEHTYAHVTTNITGLYERPTFGMPLSSELLYGTTLDVLDTIENWAFTRQADGYLGWAYRPYLSEDVLTIPTHLTLPPVIELRKEPDKFSRVITRIVAGTGISLVEKRGDWSLTNANKTGWLPSSALRALADIPESIEEKQDLLIRDAMRMTGVPYLWGGVSGNGIDCSGFVRLLHRWVSLAIPRDADMQSKAAFPVEPPYQVGDLFFFVEGDSKRNITHVGMSLGGWKMVHSSRTHNGVDVDDIQKVKYLKDKFTNAGSFLRRI